MSDLSPPNMFLDETPVAVPIPRLVQQFNLWLVSALGGSAAVGLLVFAVATQSGADAERIAKSDVRTSPAGLIGAFAAAHGRPGAL